MKLLYSLLYCFSSIAIYTAQEFDVFYLAVGNAHYENRVEKFKENYSPFCPVGGARRSARYVGELLERRANAKGLILRSEGNNLLSKENILNAVIELIKTVNHSDAENPLIVFYYCGHGVSEGIAWSQFLVPGDFTEKPIDLSTNPLAIELDILSEKLIYLGEITDLFEDSSIPYFCLIDACYETQIEDFSTLDKWFNPSTVELFKETSEVLRFMNEYHQSKPVIFATQPGASVKTVTDPNLPEGVKIGPLCRRLILIEKQLDNIDYLTLMDVVMLFQDSDFDSLTPSSISHYKIGDNAHLSFLNKE